MRRSSQALAIAKECEDTLSALQDYHAMMVAQISASPSRSPCDDVDGTRSNVLELPVWPAHSKINTCSTSSAFRRAKMLACLGDFFELTACLP